VGTIRTIAGVPGTAGYNGDGIAMSAAQLNSPQAVAISPTGQLFIADVENQRVRSCDLTTGIISTVVGTGAAGDPAPGPALECPLNDPVGMSWDSLGRLAFTVVHSEVVLSVLGGNVDILAGDGTGGFGGDGGLATAAQLDHPTSVAHDQDDNLYILDLGNGRVRRVDVAGGISTYVGIGGEGYAGDGGPMAVAQFNFPHGASPRLRLVPPEAEARPGEASKHGFGRLYIADTGNHRIRMVNMTAETIELVAGAGTPGYTGDGGSRLTAQLNLPSDVALGPDDALYIADTGNHAVRRIDALGVITTIAGSGTAGFGGDGGPGSAAQLSSPVGLFVDGAGKYLYIADQGNHAIRRVLLQ
jgi:DNA-binding beta-propeller fold protein YncE